MSSIYTLRAPTHMPPPAAPVLAPDDFPSLVSSKPAKSNAPPAFPPTPPSRYTAAAAKPASTGPGLGLGLGLGSSAGAAAPAPAPKPPPSMTAQDFPSLGQVAVASNKAARWVGGWVNQCNTLLACPALNSCCPV